MMVFHFRRQIQPRKKLWTCNNRRWHAKVQLLHSYYMRSSGLLTHLTSVFIKDVSVLSIVLSSIIFCFYHFLKVLPNVQVSFDSKGCSHQSKYQELSLLPFLPSLTQPQCYSETHPIISSSVDWTVSLTRGLCSAKTLSSSDSIKRKVVSIF